MVVLLIFWQWEENNMIITKAGVKAVAGSASTATITFASDEDAASGAAFPPDMTVRVFVTPIDPYATSFRVETSTPTTCVVNFGTAAAGGGSTFNWVAIGRD